MILLIRIVIFYIGIKAAYDAYKYKSKSDGVIQAIAQVAIIWIVLAIILNLVPTNF